MIRPALEALGEAGVAWATRGEQPLDDPPPGGDVDVLVGAADEHEAERVLTAAGFRRLHTPGHRRHRFYVAFDRRRARWLKIDVSLVPRRFGWDLAADDPSSLERFASYRVGTKARPGPVERAWSWVERRRPLGLRRQGPIVAVLGPDGAGKGTVIAAVAAQIPAGVRALYLGHGDASRDQYRRGARARPASDGGARERLRKTAAAPLRLLPPDVKLAQYHVRRALALAIRTWAAYPFAWRGDIVLCDRHPLEAFVVDAAGTSLGARLERRVLAALVRRPDAAVILDAPGAVLFARKGEHSPDLLDSWRVAYRRVFDGPGTTVVETTQGLEASVAETSAALWRALSQRRGW